MEITIDKKECLVCEKCSAILNCPEFVELGKDGYPCLVTPLPDNEKVFQEILKAMTSCPGECIKMS